MKTLRTMLFLLTLSLASTGAFAWPSCSGNWVQVPSGTSSANGTLYTTGDNLTFQCQKPTTPTTTPSTTSNTNNNSNSNNNSSASNSSSNAGAVSGSTSSSTATGGTGIGTGVATATGGQGGQGGKGGNANQGQNQGQSQSSTSSASNNGNGANNSTYSSSTVVQRNTPMAYAPEAIPSAPCVKGFSAGASGPAFGASFGGGKTDSECEIRETARAFALGGSRIAYCKVLITTKDAKKAGVTLDDCMSQPTPAPVVSTVIVPSTPPAPVVVAENEPLVITAPVESDVNNLVFGRSDTLTNVLKAQLDDAALYFKQAAPGGYLVLEADSLTGIIRTQRVQSYLSEAGINTSYIRVRLLPNYGRNVRIIYSLK